MISCSVLFPQDFHEMSHGLLLMLENIDRRKNEIVPIDSHADAEILQDQHKQLTVGCVNALF